MLGLADRVRVPMTTSSTGAGEPMWVDSSGLVTIARGELELSAQLAHGFSLEARAWIEHSERADPTLPARWTAGIQSGAPDCVSARTAWGRSCGGRCGA